MELRTLRYFIVVAQEKNITRAAELLNMSQPPLSSQMRNLEEELGVQLFVRGKRHLTLTAEGEVLLRRARQILDMEEKTVQEIISMRNSMSGTLHLALVEGRAPYLAARWIAGFREEFPLVHYNLWNGSGDDVLERLHKGLADLAIIATPYDNENVEGFSVEREPWTALIPRKHPLARSSENEIPLKCLVGQPLIVPSRKSRIQAIRQWFAEIGAEPSILCETSNYIDAAALVERQVGISIFPRTANIPNDSLVFKEISGKDKTLEYLFVWRKGRPLPSVEEKFIDYVKEEVERQRKE